MPPSAVMVVPTMYRDSSAARNATIGATSVALATPSPTVFFCTNFRTRGPISQRSRIPVSTVAQATIGGFVAGGSCGVGSINYGVLRDPGNVAALKVVTMEAEPRVLDLRGDDLSIDLNAGSEQVAEQLRADSPRLKSSLEGCGFEQIRLRVASDEGL